MDLIRKIIIKEELYSDIEVQIKKDFSWIMENKNVGYYSTAECLNIIFNNDSFITEISNKYLIPKTAIQTVLLRELRCYDVRDDIADTFVIQQFYYLNQVEIYENSEWYQQLIMGYPKMPIPYREDSSVGYGQIFASTAINASNWYKNTNYDYSDWHDREYMWNQLRENNNFNIEMIAMVLIWGANDKGLKKEYWKYSEDEMKEMFARYNGTNSDAKKYGDEVYNCYLIFDNYNTN